MPTYTYVARSRDGRKERGNLTAANRQALVKALQTRGLVPDSIKERGVRKGIAKRKGPKVKTVEILIFTRQLSTIVNAGLPLLQGLDILAEQTDDPRFAAVMQEIGRDVEGGDSFSDALKKHPRVFSELFVSMIRAGEASGNLDEVLLQLADYLESMEELKRKVKAAMTYPVAAFSMIILIAAGLIVWVVPQFEEIFSNLSNGKTALPAPTRLLIFISNVLTSWQALIVVAMVVGMVILFRLYRQTESGRYTLDKLLLRLPKFGGIFRKLAISRFARTLSTLTRSGVSILAALEIVERTAGNEVFARAVRSAADSVRNGETLADPLMRSEEFPAMVTRMIAVGEKTGALETMLAKVSDFYDSEVRASVDSLTSLIEPLLIAMMGIVVGGIVIALFMPILQLSSLISN